MYDDDFEATFPFQEVSMYLFEYGGKFYVATVDRYSGWPCVTGAPDFRDAQQQPRS